MRTHRKVFGFSSTGDYQDARNHADTLTQQTRLRVDGEAVETTQSCTELVPLSSCHWVGSLRRWVSARRRPETLFADRQPALPKRSFCGRRTRGRPPPS